MNKPNLDARLLSVAKFVREGAYACDIGTDHAYLPVYLVVTGRAERALASDINKGPVMRAEESVARYGVSDKIKVILSDGLAGAEKYPVTDIIVAGMGGELITSILEAAKWTRDGKYRLILQPMTHAEILRKYLADNGFEIIDEDIVSEPNDKKIYQIICAEFSGKAVSYTAEELYLGKCNISRGGEELTKLCERLKKINIEIKRAKESAGQDAHVENEIIAVADKYLC
jgi:tRNA (adenine22-N1)-methyltransferase